MKMKAIVYRGGVLRFRIPASWKEEYSDVDGGTFYEDVPHSGTLRVKVITLEISAESGGVSLPKVLEPLPQHLEKSQEDVQYVGENALVRYDEPSVEKGTRLRIFYWVLANPVHPRNARVVTFSYTVLDSQTNRAQLQPELDMLNAEILRTEFAPPRDV